MSNKNLITNLVGLRTAYYAYDLIMFIDVFPLDFSVSSPNHKRLNPVATQNYDLDWTAVSDQSDPLVLIIG